MGRTLEDVWRDISPYLDEAIELEGEARKRWLSDLEVRNPAAAAALRTWLADLSALGERNFLAQDLTIAGSLVSLTGQRVGSYTLERSIGQGGMGSVWLARRSDGRFEGQVAVKLLNVSLLGRDAEGRFRREGHLLAKLEHPNIARLLDAGVTDAGQPFLVLEYVRGQPITEYCNTARLNVRARITLFLEVLAAVSHAHSRLVIHRDQRHIGWSGRGLAAELDRSGACPDAARTQRRSIESAAIRGRSCQTAASRLLGSNRKLHARLRASGSRSS